MKLRRILAASMGFVLLMLSASGNPLPVGRVSAASSGFVFSFASTFSAYSGFSAALDELARSNSTFAIALGDLGYGLVNESTWCDKFHRHFPDVEILAGRSDTGTPPPLPVNINNFVNDCPFTLGVPPIGVYGKEYYFDYPLANPLARFILISPDLTFFDDPGAPFFNYSVGTPHYNWTAKAIDDARALGIPWVIVGAAKDCISIGEHPCDIGTDLFNMLLQKKVDLILQGFTHSYQRSKQLAIGGSGCVDGIQLAKYTPACVAADGANGSYRKGAGSVVVLSGTGGREIVPFNSSSPYVGYFARWMNNDSQSPKTNTYGYGFSTFNISSTGISMRTYFNVTYQDNFTITQSPDSSQRSSTPFSDLLIYVALLAIAGIIVVAAVFWRRKRSKRKPGEPDL